MLSRWTATLQDAALQVRDAWCPDAFLGAPNSADASGRSWVGGLLPWQLPLKPKVGPLLAVHSCFLLLLLLLQASDGEWPGAGASVSWVLACSLAESGRGQTES